MLRSPRTVLAVLALVVLGAGCGQENAGQAIEVDRDVPGITVPGTDIPYEAGGADGSGADGSEDPQGRGGVAAGPDTSEPSEQRGADREIKPPRGESTEE